MPRPTTFSQFIDSEESRELCRHAHRVRRQSSAKRPDGLASVEGTVRYRLKLLAPKLIAAGFDPFNKEELQ